MYIVQAWARWEGEGNEPMGRDEDGGRAAEEPE